MNTRPYIRKLNRRQWWLGAPRYRRYMLRELTAIFLGVYAFSLIIGLWCLSRGAYTFEVWLSMMHSPLGLCFNALILLAAVYHSITWFNVTPKAIVVRIGTRRVPDSVVIATHYGLWLLCSILIFLGVRI